MHTVWVRLNAVVFFSLSVLLVLALLASFSAIPSILGDNGNSDHPMEAIIHKVRAGGARQEERSDDYLSRISLKLASLVLSSCT